MARVSGLKVNREVFLEKLRAKRIEVVAEYDAALAEWEAERADMPVAEAAWFVEAKKVIKKAAADLGKSTYDEARSYDSSRAFALDHDNYGRSNFHVKLPQKPGSQSRKPQYTVNLDHLDRTIKMLEMVSNEEISLTYDLQCWVDLV